MLKLYIKKILTYSESVIHTQHPLLFSLFWSWQSFYQTWSLEIFTYISYRESITFHRTKKWKPTKVQIAIFFFQEWMGKQCCRMGCEKQEYLHNQSKGPFANVCSYTQSDICSIVWWSLHLNMFTLPKKNTSKNVCQLYHMWLAGCQTL